MVKDNINKVESLFNKIKRAFVDTDEKEQNDIIDKLIELSKQELQKNDILKTTKNFVESISDKTEQC